MAIKNVRVWTDTGRIYTLKANIPALNAMPEGVTSDAQYFRTQLIYADEICEILVDGDGDPIFSGLGMNIAPAGYWARLNDVRRFRLLS